MMIRISQTARTVPFDKLGSSLNSNNVQDAIQEIHTSLNEEKQNRQTEDDKVFYSISAFRDYCVVSQEVIQNGIELSADDVSDIIPNSIFAFIDRVGIFENLDFNISNGLSGKVIFNFLPDAIFSINNQNGFVEGGEQLRIHYLTRIR